jgi:ribosomal subunit interface protein
MQVSTTGKQIDVGESLRAHVSGTLDRLVGKYFGNPIDAQAVFAREAHLVCCDLTVHVGRDILTNSHGAAGDAYAAFDAAAERIDKRLRRQKRRLRHHHARTAAPASPAMSYVVAPEEPEEGPHADGDDRPPLVIAEMATSVPTLSVSEAVMRIDLGDEGALLFRNRTHGGLNLVYRRADGNIGWVDPDFAASEAW